MSFIEKNLNKGEKLDQIEKPSIKPSLFFFAASICVLLFVVYDEIFGGPTIDRSNPKNYNDHSNLILITVMVIFYSLILYSERFLNEYGITNQRVISKSGIVSRNIEEMSLKSIESINVKQSILGRILNYGSISITGRGNAVLVFKDIDSPVEIRKKIQNKS